ncbi:hypothetical protein A2690_02500 [Candidatus Roizmanbacteria bacterium RIFCSPHIGHO2_01_FULL_39_12b]|uniref:Glycosyltransferase 2-like domain-containing protein n=1 Tax=Candidatus Roizmanbacteria bacterium RIFCSPHIGHO2_01_FULL_39_12b TaxID=1802030 RepID=A0A1F7GDR6_9BACT|nr:MAG: hypothetical protein A2690_02500 [Candidatus Roizmanbacteria bacterium RIFCSPHIGHO2_01_FULL_39_12b]OGK46631.1 MAG: hypothetical protein A3B46_00300 [Candidatus Roizmanbacteria bacterium RIFCSPLOWO2_01_FULL_39_19]
MTDLSIIIISYNTVNITKKCLDTVFESLKNADFQTEIIVVDNNSTDESVEMLNGYRLQVASYKKIFFQTIFSKENLGFAKGNNLAVRQAKGRNILFLNSDIEVIEDAIPKIYNYFIRQSKFSFVGGKLFNKDMSPQDSAAPFYSILVIVGALFLRGDYLHITRFSPNKTKQVDWVSGACIMTTRENYDKIGGFDENIFMYMDEVDLLYRARTLGMLTGFYSDAHFIHLGSASSRGRTQPILQVYKGLLYFYKKHHNHFDNQVLKFLLHLKAYIAFIIGKISKNHYLISTYAEALEIVKNN